MPFQIRLIPLLVIVGLIVGVVFVAGGSSRISDVLPLPDAKHRVSCDVSVKNPAFLDLEIDRFFCERQSACVFSFAVPQLSLFSDKGTLQMTAVDGARVARQVEVTELGTKTVQLSVCTSVGAGKLNVLNKDSVVISTKDWTVLGEI